MSGIAGKLVGGNASWVLGVYVFSLGALFVNWAIYLRNRRIDAKLPRR